MIPFVRDFQFEYGKADQVSPMIRRVVANNPGPFTFTGTGTYIIGKGKLAVIDPGPDMPDHLDALLEATRGETITHIFVTHNHMDHSPLSRPLAERTGAIIHACAFPGQPTESEVRMEAGDDRSFKPDIGLCDGGVFEGDGWTIEAIPTPGHTSNHICYALKEENALFSGDHIMGWSTTVISPPDGDMADYFDSLDKIRARQFDTLWPTHGPPIRQVDTFIGAYIDHRRSREAQILSTLARGPNSIRDMVPELYAAVDPKLYPAAAHSMLAHVVQLVGEGRIVSEGAPGVQSRLMLAGG